ncbi:MAG TPA: NnrU family protein, partial [Arenicellales bacterium]|nr:NnrU family protein [Arenicellales bacterium]
VGLILFLGIHSVSIVNEPWRDRMVERLGEWPWKGLYSLVALVGLILIVQGYGAARYDPIVVYAPPVWLRHIAFLLLIPVFPLVLATYFPGRISAATRHPMLVAVKLWAFAHLLANGMLADLLLFGGFLAWAVADRISFKRRTPRAIPQAPQSGLNDVIAVVGGLLIYGAFVGVLHEVLIGVPVM